LPIENLKIKIQKFIPSFKNEDKQVLNPWNLAKKSLFNEKIINVSTQILYEFNAWKLHETYKN
jgi:hypothetical protein